MKLLKPNWMRVLLVIIILLICAGVYIMREFNRKVSDTSMMEAAYTPSAD